MSIVLKMLMDSFCLSAVSPLKDLLDCNSRENKSIVKIQRKAGRYNESYGDAREEVLLGYPCHFIKEDPGFP